MEGRSEAVKVALDEVVDSVRDFSDRIIENSDGYTVNEIELAHRLRLCVIFYRARERGEALELPSLERLNEIAREELNAISEKHAGQDEQEVTVCITSERETIPES